MENGQLLESWKEISDYLKRSERTCRRWELTLGLPVHRLDGTPSARVFAYPAELDQWLEEKLHHREEEAAAQSLRSRRIKKWLLPLAALGAVGLALLVLRFFPFPAPVPFDNPILAVVPFENPGGDESVERWRTAFPDLLITDLRQSRYLNVFAISDIDRTLAGLKLTGAKKFTPEDLGKISGRLDSDFAATGSLHRSGGRLRITVSICDARSGQALPSLEADCSDENGFFEAADDLGERIKGALGLTRRQLRGDINKGVAMVSTSSPEAFRLFSEGYRLGSQNKYPESVFSLKKAAEIDPGFGLAYKYLSLSSRNTGRNEDLIAYAHQSLDHAGRVPVKESLLLEAELYEFFEKDLHKALRANEKLWSLYPDFPEGPAGRLFLPMLCLQLEEYDKAIAAIEKLNPIYRKRENVISVLYQCYLAKGQVDRVDKILNDFKIVNPAGARVMLLNLQRKRALLERRFDEALTLTREALPNDRYLHYDRTGYVFWARDDFDNAEKEYRTIPAIPNRSDEGQRLVDLSVLSVSRGRIEEAIDLLKKRQASGGGSPSASADYGNSLQMARLNRMAGRLPEALREVEAACRDTEKRGFDALPALQLRARITLDLGRSEEFRRRVEEIKTVVEREPYPKLMRIYHHLLGCEEMKKGNFDEAIGRFLKALDLLPPVRLMTAESEIIAYYFDLAEAYFAKKDYQSLDAAWKWFVKSSNMTDGRSWSGDLYAKCFLRMAQLSELDPATLDPREKRANAIENYEKFLSLMAGADPIFSADIETAKKSIARLQAE